jgi:glycopeptide antibiotics resistance protein
LWAFITEPTALAVMVAALAVAWPIGGRLAAHSHCTRANAILFVVTIGMVVALTMTPNEPTTGTGVPMPPHFLQQLGDGPLIWAKLTAAPDDSEQLANVALYIPVGFLGRLVWRNAVRAAGFGMALTVFIETCQYGIVGRAGSITDIRNNTAGAILGALFAATATRVRRRLTSPH